MTVYVKSQTILYNRTIGLGYKVDKQTDDYASHNSDDISPKFVSKKKIHSQLMRFSLFSLSLPDSSISSVSFFFRNSQVYVFLSVSARCKARLYSA